MANYTRNTLTGSLGPVNAELEKIQQSLQDKFDRNPTVGQNTELLNDLDANSNRIINLAPPRGLNDAVRLKDLSVASGQSILPVQEGNAGGMLSTDGESAFWKVEDFDAGKLSTLDLINSTLVFPSDYVVATEGFTSKGDGGEGIWKKNGVINQTVKQTPLQLNGALLNDGNGNQWEWVSTGGEITPEGIGYQKDGDLVPYLNVAFNYFVSQTRGVLKLRASVYSMATQFTHVGGNLNVTIDCQRDSTRIRHNSSSAGFLFTGQVSNFHLRGYPEIINNGKKTVASTQAFFVFQAGNTNSSFQADYRPSQLSTDADLLAGFYYCAPSTVNDTIDFYLNCSGISDSGVTLGAGSTVYFWGGRLIGAWKPFPTYASIGLNVTGGMGGLYVMGTDIIQNRINTRIAKDTGVSNREIFFSPAILDSSWRSLEVTDESYVSASGIWAASANDACIYYAPTLDTDNAALVIAGGTIFNAGVNDPSALDGDGVGIKMGANGRVVCSGVYFRNNVGRAISKIATGGSRFSTFDACSFSTNATRVGVLEQIFINGNMKLTNITSSESDTLIVNRGGVLGFKMRDVDTQTGLTDNILLTGSGVPWINRTGHDVMVYIRNGTGTSVSLDGAVLLNQPSGNFSGFSLKVPLYSELSAEYTVAPNVVIQRL